MNIYRTMSRVIQNLKLRQKLLLSYFILIIIPLGIYTLFSYSEVNKIVEKHIIFSASRAFDQTNGFISYKISNIIKVSEVIILDNNINRILAKAPESYSLPEQYNDMANLRQYLDSFKDANDVFQVKLFVNDEFVYSNGDDNISNLKKAGRTVWYDKLIHSQNKVLMCPPAYFKNDETGSSQLLSVARRLKNSDDYNETLGFLRVDFLEKNIRSILANANTVNGSLTYMANSENSIVSATDSMLADRYKVDITAVKALAENKDWSVREINSRQAFVKTRIIPNTDWYMVTIIPSDEIFSDIVHLRAIMFLIMLMVGTVAYAVSVYITYNITNRIQKLIRRMKSVQSGELENATLSADSTDEIGELTQNYNFMIHRISSLIEEQYLSGIELKNAELKALQAQINPHFLYNTLDMINWMSYEDKGAEIRSLVKALSTFYKLSLNKGKDLTTIQDEILHVSLYVQIQNVRLKDKISFHVDIDEKIKKCSILKITLQPVVENSILHGILGRPEKCGSITINGAMEENDITITVKDDGIGISGNIAATILTDEYRSKSGSGYGIRNIHDRIKLYFGQGYGLSINSEYGSGTSVIIKIPAITSGDI